MELLSIDERQNAYFSRDGSRVPISQIEKEDILHLIEAIAVSGSITMTACDAEHPIKNPIEQTIYENLYSVLHDLSENREIYLREVDEKFEEYESKMSLQDV